MVTVAFAAWSIIATGLPTTSERPTTVTRAPSSGTPAASSRCMTAPAVHGA